MPTADDSYETLEAHYDLEALKWAALLVLASAAPDDACPGLSRVSNKALAALREALRDPYIPNL